MRRPREEADRSNVIALRPGIAIPKPPQRAPRKSKKRLRPVASNTRNLRAEASPLKAEKLSHDSDLRGGMRPIQVKASGDLKPSPENHSLLSKAELHHLIDTLSATQLRERFRLTETSHKDMLGRRKLGFVVDPRLVKFSSFLRHVGQRPSRAWSLDRRDPGNPLYAPETVGWSDARQQANNRRCTIFLRIGPETKPLTDWARQTGQSPKTIRTRLSRGATHEQAVYGRRGAAAPPEPTPSAPSNPVDAWPAGSTPSFWEPGYEVFSARFGAGLRVLTRVVFFYWIVDNQLRCAHAQLRALFPGYGDPDVMEPGEPDPPAVLESKPGRIVATRQGLARKAWSILQANPAQYDLARSLCTVCPSAYDPGRAAADYAAYLKRVAPSRADGEW